MTMEETPRTEAVLSEVWRDPDLTFHVFVPTVLIAHARQLETELSAARMTMEELMAENARLKLQVETAMQIVHGGLDLMTDGQVGKWRGVRTFLEQPTEDYAALSPAQEG